MRNSTIINIVFSILIITLAACAYSPKVNEGWAIQIAQNKAWELDGQLQVWKMRGKVPSADLFGPHDNVNIWDSNLKSKLAGKHFWEVGFSSYGPMLEHGLFIYVDAQSGEVLGYLVD